MGTNSTDYWKMAQSNREARGLPKIFSVEVFFSTCPWYAHWPTMNLSHKRDLLALDDKNYKPPSTNVAEKIDDKVSDHPNENPMDVAFTDNNTDKYSNSAFTLVQPTTNSP